MSNHTFIPGFRVRAFPLGQLGTVADAPEISEQHPGFVPVIFDDSDKACPCSADNLVVIEREPVVDCNEAESAIVAELEKMLSPGLEHFSDAELKAEIARREELEREARLASAVETLREKPYLVGDSVTVAQIWVNANNLGLQPSELIAAWYVVRDEFLEAIK